MTAFAAALGAIFADPHIGVDAVWKPGGAGAGTALRVIRKSPDEVSDWNGGRFVQDAELVDLRVADAPGLAAGDILEIAGEAFTVAGAPRRDREGLVWSAELQRG